MLGFVPNQGVGASWKKGRRYFNSTYKCTALQLWLKLPSKFRFAFKVSFRFNSFVLAFKLGRHFVFRQGSTMFSDRIQLRRRHCDQVTERNPISSRSHAVCHITVLGRKPQQQPNPAAAPVARRGVPEGEQRTAGQLDSNEAAAAMDGSGEEAKAEQEKDAGTKEVDAAGGYGGDVSAAATAAAATAAGEDLVMVSLGRLALVDLAGSERNYETLKMSAAQHKESGDINTSLMALKDCFRAHAATRSIGGEAAAAAAAEVVSMSKQLEAGANEKKKKHPEGVSTVGAGQLPPTRPPAAAGGRMPFRAHRLTQVLKGCFTDPTHRTVGFT